MKDNLKKRILGYGLAVAVLTLCLWLPGVFAPLGTGSTLPNGQPVDPGALGGQVRIRTCDAQVAASFSELAAEYSRMTGVKVQVILAEEACRETLASAMEDPAAPTLLCIHSPQQMETWAESLYDLSGTQAYGLLLSPDFAYGKDGKILALTADMEGYGLIYNAQLLASVGTRDDIEKFADLSVMCQMIQSNNAGHATFTAPDFSDAGHRGNACMLYQLLPDPAEMRSFLDLYLQYDAPAEDSLQQFLTGNSIFYLGGTWDYEKVSAIGNEKLELVPVYSENTGSFQCVTNWCWAVNGKVSPMDIQRTLEFLDWLVTKPAQGGVPVDKLGLVSPFRDTAAYNNLLEKKLREYIKTEPYQVSWECGQGLTEEDLDRLSAALATYCAEPTDAGWQVVANILTGT